MDYARKSRHIKRAHEQDDVEVEGHGMRIKATDGDDTPDTEVEGHVAQHGVTPPGDEEPEVEGHRRRFHATDQAQLEDEEFEVEGHMNPILAGEVARDRVQDMLGAAARARQVSGTSQPRDGGIIDKVRKLAER